MDAFGVGLFVGWEFPDVILALGGWTVVGLLVSFGGVVTGLLFFVEAVIT